MKKHWQHLTILVLIGLAGLGGCVAASAQVSFEESVKDLASPDAAVRLRAARALRQAAYPEAAVPLARLVTDPQDAVQLEAITAEVGLFTVPSSKRGAVSAESAFTEGLDALTFRPVPIEVLTALRAAVGDDNPRVGLEALYAFGTLASEPNGAARRDLLRASGPELAAAFGARDAARRRAAARVVGRVFARRAQDDAVDAVVGDAVITALNDKDHSVKSAAAQALGEMRYERAAQPLTELFTFYRKGPAAEAALDALGRIASPSSAALFTAQLSSPSPAFRAIAVEGLARLGGAPRLTEIQTTLSRERVESVQLAMVFASTLVSGTTIDQLGEALVVPRLHDRAKAYLVEIAPGRSALFSRHFRDPDERIRLEVAQVLLLGGDPAALPMIEPLTHDKDPDVAHAAERAVARLRSASGKPLS
jgi:HEAT repeat protein